MNWGHARGSEERGDDCAVDVVEGEKGGEELIQEGERGEGEFPGKGVEQVEEV